MSIRATLTCDLSGCGVTFGINVAGDTLFDASVPVQAAVSSTPCGDHGACDRQSGNASRVVNAFHLSAPAVRSVTAGSWVGAVTHGSSVNCDNVSFCIHGSGTHAECVGHITPDGPTINSFAPRPPLAPGLLLTVAPRPLASAVPLTVTPPHTDTSADAILLLPYPSAAPGDMVVDACSLRDALVTALTPAVTALAPAVRAALEREGVRFATAAQRTAAMSTAAVAATVAATAEWNETATTLPPASEASLRGLFASIPPAILTLSTALTHTVILRTLAPQALLHAAAPATASATDAPAADKATPATVAAAPAPSASTHRLAGSFAAVHAAAAVDAITGAVTFSGAHPPYLTACAAAFLCALPRPPQTLVVDLPSLDREDDGGLVLTHFVFFRSLWWRNARGYTAEQLEEHCTAAVAASNVSSVADAGASAAMVAAREAETRAGVLAAAPDRGGFRAPCTTAELQRLRSPGAVLVELAWLPSPAALADGPVAAAVQVAPVESDAAPARPLLMPATLTAALTAALPGALTVAEHV